MSKAHVLAPLAATALFIITISCAAQPDLEMLDGEWVCESTWRWEHEGTATPCSARWKVTIVQGLTRTQGTLLLGDAAWEETSEGVGRTSGYDLHHTRTTHTLTPQNAAARAFERDVLGGRSLAPSGDGSPSQSRIITLSDAELILRNDQGRITTCERPQPPRAP